MFVDQFPQRLSVNEALAYSIFIQASLDKLIGGPGRNRIDRTMLAKHCRPLGTCGPTELLLAVLP